MSLLVQIQLYHDSTYIRSKNNYQAIDGWGQTGLSEIIKQNRINVAFLGLPTFFAYMKMKSDQRQPNVDQLIQYSFARFYMCWKREGIFKYQHPVLIKLWLISGLSQHIIMFWKRVNQWEWSYDELQVANQFFKIKISWSLVLRINSQWNNNDLTSN